MNENNESTHERLNRELRRMALRDRSLWMGWVALFGAVGAFVFFALNVPVETRYVTGIAGQSMALPTEDRIIIQTRVEVEGITYDLRLPSQLVHPAVGEEICLRAAKHRFTGHTSYVSVSKTLCDNQTDAPETTPDVD